MHTYTLYAGGIQHLTDARYFAARGFGWLGLQTDPAAPASLSLAEARAIAEWVEGPSICIEPGFAAGASWGQLITEAGASALLAEGFVPDDVPAMEGIRLFIRVTSTERAALESFRYLSQTATLIARPGDLDLLKRLLPAWPILLDIGELSVADIRAMEPGDKLAGFYIGGSQEEAKGVKSYDETDEKLDALEEKTGYFL